jgi:hypothetical protein
MTLGILSSQKPAVPFCRKPQSIAVLNKQKCLFFKTENRKVKQVLSGVAPVGRGG